NSMVDFSKSVDYQILGTDLSTEALKMAVKAIYKFERIKDVPADLRSKYFLRSKDREANTVRVKAELRRKVAFRRMNLVGTHHEIQEQFDMIFCRNVLIYFDKETQESVINKLCTKLRPGGFFFLGHSESIIGKNVPLKSVMPTVYQKV
ncbi:MAG: CheR family methyltransferase, partial [Bacteroidota bacterium]